MTTRQQQANALRVLANLIEYGNLPSNDYHLTPLHTWLAFRSEADRQEGVRILKFSGFNRQASENENNVSVIHGETLGAAGLEISLTVPTEDKD